MREELYGEIFVAEQTHWWFVARHRIVLHLLERYLPAEDGVLYTVADLGCGCGMMLQRLAANYDAIGIDGSHQAINFALQRGVNAKFGALPEDVPLSRETYDAGCPGTSEVRPRFCRGGCKSAKTRRNLDLHRACSHVALDKIRRRPSSLSALLREAVPLLVRPAFH
jgi:SAM-dependent methyltransferase